MWSEGIKKSLTLWANTLQEIIKSPLQCLWFQKLSCHSWSNQGLSTPVSFCITSPEVTRRYVAVPSNCTQEGIARDEKDRSPLGDWTSSVPWRKPRTANSLHKQEKIAAKCLGHLEVYVQPVISCYVPKCPSNLLQQPRPCLCMWLQPN